MKNYSKRNSKKVLTAVIASILFLTCFMSIQTASASMFSGKTISSGSDGANGTIQKQFSVVKPVSNGTNNSESITGARGSLNLDNATPSYTIKTDENEQVADLCKVLYYCCLHPKVTYHPNGGVGAITEVKVICSGWHRVRNQGYYRTGYTFLGYNTMPNGTGKWYSIGQLICLLPCKNLTLYAQWCQNQQQLLTVTYNPNGGIGSIIQDRVVPNTNYTIQDQGYIRDNYIFDGWNTQANGLGVNYSIDQVVRLTSSLTLYAKWRQNPQLLTVTYNPNGGTGEIVQDIVTRNTSYAIKDQSYTWGTFVFDGWNTQPNGLGVSYSVGQITYLTNSITLYAKWRSSQVMAVTYYPNGGNGSIQQDLVASNTNYTIKDISCTRANYTFDCWNTRADGLGANFTKGQIVKLTSPLALYAKWKSMVPKFTVVYIINNGTDDVRIYEVNTYTFYTFQAQNFLWSGYLFSHWNTKPDGTGANYYNGATVYLSDNIVVYAQWRR